MLIEVEIAHVARSRPLRLSRAHPRHRTDHPSDEWVGKQARPGISIARPELAIRK